MATSLSWWSPGSAYLHSSVHPYKSSDTGDSNQDRQSALNDLPLDQEPVRPKTPLLPSISYTTQHPPPKADNLSPYSKEAQVGCRIRHIYSRFNPTWNCSHYTLFSALLTYSLCRHTSPNLTFPSASAKFAFLCFVCEYTLTVQKRSSFTGV